MEKTKTNLFIRTGHNVWHAKICQHYGAHTQNLKVKNAKNNNNKGLSWQRLKLSQNQAKACRRNREWGQ